jgi:uncharacterized protein YjdB
MKKHIFFIVLFIINALWSNAQTMVPVTEIKLNVDTIYIGIGEFFNFDATVLPLNATDKSLVWSVSDYTIVRSDSSTILGVAP